MMASGFVSFEISSHNDARALLLQSASEELEHCPVTTDLTVCELEGWGVRFPGFI